MFSYDTGKAYKFEAVFVNVNNLTILDVRNDEVFDCAVH